MLTGYSPQGRYQPITPTGAPLRTGPGPTGTPYQGPGPMPPYQHPTSGPGPGPGPAQGSAPGSAPYQGPTGAPYTPYQYATAAMRGAPWQHPGSAPGPGPAQRPGPGPTGLSSGVYTPAMMNQFEQFMGLMNTPGTAPLIQQLMGGASSGPGFLGMPANTYATLFKPKVPMFPSSTKAKAKASASASAKARASSTMKAKAKAKAMPSKKRVATTTRSTRRKSPSRARARNTPGQAGYSLSHY